MTSTHLPIAGALLDYVIDRGVRDDPLLKRLREQTYAMRFGHMQVSPEQGQLLGFLVGLTGAKRVLEIGVFTGYSSLCMARALSEGGVVVGIDNQKPFTDIAEGYWKEAGVRDRIDLQLGDALPLLRQFLDQGAAGSFDMVFLDADKEHYAEYYELCLELLRKDGLLVVDNVLWYGHVADPAHEEATTVAIRALNKAIRDDERVEMALLPFADGMTLVRKL